MRVWESLNCQSLIVGECDKSIKNLLWTLTLWSRIEEEEYFLSSCFQEEEEDAVDYLEESWSDMAHWAGG